MPKFKIGDEFGFLNALHPESGGVILDIFENQDEEWYTVRVNGSLRPGVQSVVTGDDMWVSVPKYVKGDIWRSRDRKHVFIVIDPPSHHRGDIPCFRRLTASIDGNSFGGVDWYIETYGPLIKWVPTP